MKKNRPTLRGGFTLIELLVVIAIIGLLAGLSFPALQGALFKAQLTKAINNAKQIHLATSAAAVDQSAGTAPGAGWPADAKIDADETKGSITTAIQFADMLNKGGYLKGLDLKVFALGKAVPYSDSDGSDSVAANNLGFKVWNIGDAATDSSAVFLTTDNFEGKAALITDAAKSYCNYGEKGYVVFRKGGDGSAYTKKPKDDTEAQKAASFKATDGSTELKPLD